MHISVNILYFLMGIKLYVGLQGDMTRSYDLEADPGEFHNLWNDASTQTTKARLMELLVPISSGSECSKMELNMDKRAVKAKPIANIDFIFTIVRSLLVFFSFSSSCSIFLFLLLSRLVVSPCASLIFSNFLLCFSISVFNFCLQ